MSSSPSQPRESRRKVRTQPNSNNVQQRLGSNNLQKKTSIYKQFEIEIVVSISIASFRSSCPVNESNQRQSWYNRVSVPTSSPGLFISIHKRPHLINHKVLLLRTLGLHQIHVLNPRGSFNECSRKRDFGIDRGCGCCRVGFCGEEFEAEGAVHFQFETIHAKRGEKG